MQACFRWVSLVAVFLGLSPQSYGQGDTHNAAAHYQRAFERMPALSENEWLLVMIYYDPSAGSPTSHVDSRLHMR